MKVGLITFHRAINNGAVLQAYALSRALALLGVDAVYLDYTAKAIKDSYIIQPLFKRRSLKSVLLYFLCDRNLIATHEKFHVFASRYLPISEPVDKHNFEHVASRFDILMSGGDQVWNLELTGGDLHYFWDVKFDKRLVSYGSSFGRTAFSKEQLGCISRLLSRYSDICVREESGKELIESLVGNKCLVVPDPVFLLSREDWIETFKLKNKKAKYILFFELHKNLEMREAAIRLHDETGLPILRLTNDFRRYKKMKNVKRTGPLEFLDLVFNSDYVITDSFHACAFSLIFRKQFFVGLKTGELVELNTRIYGLVKTFGVQEQILTKGSSFTRVDYSVISRTIEKQREFGLKVLSDIVAQHECKNKN